MKKPTVICWMFAMIFLLPVSLLAGTATVQWQANQEGDLNRYKLYYGTASRSYGPPIPVGQATSYTFNNLNEGVRHYFAVTAVDESGNESGFSAEVSKDVTYTQPTDTQPPVVVISSPVSTSAYQSPGSTIALSGSASDNLGVTQVLWSVTSGGGGTASGTAAWSIQGINLSTGQNDITVTARDAAGNLGSAVVTVTYVPAAAPGPAGPLLEAGEATVKHEWRRITFQKVFTDPIVVASSLSNTGKQPSVVRVRNVDASGFEIRVQEWEYLDGKHGFETVGYLVVERGVHTLQDGTRLEAGRFNTDNTGTFKAFQFSQGFARVPILIPSISSSNGPDAVTSRLRNITTTGFEFMMQEQEASRQMHGVETVSYVAWEPSSGTAGDLTFEVAMTGKNVRGKSYTSISFAETHSNPAVFLAAMQSTEGADAAALRWANKGSQGVEVIVEEERSKDFETGHQAEVVGYVVVSPGTLVVANR
jgi:hypothetical protein